MTSTDEDVSAPTDADAPSDPDAAESDPDAAESRPDSAQSGPDAAESDPSEVGPDSGVSGANADPAGAESTGADAGEVGGESVDPDADQAEEVEATNDNTDSVAETTDGTDAGGPTGFSGNTGSSGDTGFSGDTGSSGDAGGGGSTDAADSTDAEDSTGTTSGADTAATGADQTSDPVDLGPPYLIVDQYSGDSGKNPPWANLVARPEFYGVILKAWEGAHFNDGGWFTQNWPAVKLAGGDRYGSSWFRGAYLFLKFDTSPVAQADAYLQVIRGAGGWDYGDILPVVDVELGAAANTNRTASRQQVIDYVSQCAARLKEKTSRRVMLYGRGAMRDLGITDKMGCDVVWNPSYTPTMHKAGLEAFALDDIVLWQYCGDNQAYLPDYPHQVTGFAKIDISVFVKGTSKPTLDDVRTGLLS